MSKLKFFLFWLKNIFKKRYFVSAEIEDMEKNIFHYESIVSIPICTLFGTKSVQSFIYEEFKAISLNKVEILCISKL